MANLSSNHISSPLESRVLNTIAIGTIIVDEDLVIEGWNQFMVDHTGVTMTAAIGHRLDDLFRSDRMNVLRRKVGNVLRLGHYEFIDAHVYGHLLPIRCSRSVTADFKYIQQSCVIVPLKSDADAKPRVCISMSDDTHLIIAEQELHRIRAELETANRIDPLTSILNRGTILATFAEELSRAERYERPLSIALLDIDFFKAVNDTHGHLAGDEVLRQVAATLQKLCRASDSVGRYGGEEFVALLPETDEESALLAAERFRRGIEAIGVPWEGETIHPTASFGVLQAPTGSDQNALLNAADEALYVAKGAGRNCVRRGVIAS